MYFFGVNFPIGTYCAGANIYAFCMSNTTLMIPRIFRNFTKELRYSNDDPRALWCSTRKETLHTEESPKN